MKLALVEMYIQGVTQVSQAAQQMEATLEAWRNRPLSACPYVYLDACYERVRQNGLVQKAAVLIAVDVDEAGKRSVRGVSVALSEHEAHWRSYVQGLDARGSARSGCAGRAPDR